ncbi:MAG: EthD domain-containing protein [Sphingopyxis sp.]|uniref:EthD domain-containing protein n=1 Tax=unclassified Sphingopyxis TaxID=2614943 RepID=UPI001A638407|nr:MULTISPECIES: EthD domain-containing protein [unclassified Sphingopyxis]MBL9068778.1 EthD domain-containing protein [Sphingopyxis sp.]
MITVLVAAKKLPHLSQAEFTRYWLDEHAPLVKSVPEFMQYVKRYVIYPNLQDSGPDAPVLGQVPEHHGIGELRFKNVAAMEAAFLEPRYLELIRPDEDKFLDRANCVTFITEEHVQFGD